jgi:hypothetical protein
VFSSVNEGDPRVARQLGFEDARKLTELPQKNVDRCECRARVKANGQNFVKAQVGVGFWKPILQALIFLAPLSDQLVRIAKEVRGQPALVCHVTLPNTRN